MDVLKKKMCVYSIKNTISGKIYIGIAKNSFWSRYKGGKWWIISNNEHLKNAAKKYGVENFKVEILESDIVSYDVLLELESAYITKFDSVNTGYNKTTGGRQPIFSDESNKKKSQKLKEYYERIGGSMFKGKPGTKHSDETKKHLSDIKINKPGHPHTEEHKKHMSSIMSGRRISDEAKKKLSEINKIANLGANNPNAKAIINLETQEVYGTMNEAIKKLNISRIMLLRCIDGTCNKYKLEYKGGH